MEEKNLTEVESLELITRMIQQTKDRLNIGSGNDFLIGGYVSAVVSVLVGVTVQLTSCPYYYLLYFLIPLFIYIGTKLVQKNLGQEGVSRNYTSQLLAKLWSGVSLGFLVAAIVVAIFGFIAHILIFEIFWILGFIIPGFGCFVTGIVLRERMLSAGGAFGFGCGVAMMEELIFTQGLTVGWCWVFALSFIVMMVIPGHYMNYKAKKQNAQ